MDALDTPYVEGMVGLGFLDPCNFREPHEAHVKPGALRNYCLGMAPEYPSERTHTALCANRRLTDRVFGLPFKCECPKPHD